MIIGLTGPSGSGKSHVAALLKKRGFHVIDADETAKNAAEKGSPGLKAICDVFGRDGILKTDGSLDRPSLARIVFSDRLKLELLNQTLHPFIIEMINNEIKTTESEDIVIDAPALFESGLDSVCDKTVFVTAAKALRIERVIKRDNISRGMAVLRVNAQHGDDFYESRSGFVLNTGDGSDIDEALNKITGRKNV